MKRKNGLSFLIFFLIGLAGCGYLIYHLKPLETLPSFGEYLRSDMASSSFLTIMAPRGNIYSMIATSSEDRERGLSGRIYLPGDEGMIFTFSSEGLYGFWMKDTLIPLDMVWINADKTVAGIAANVRPETYPQIFLPPQPILYVLELNAGAAEKFGIATGTPLTFVI